jgi:hypothetical protein
MEDYRLGAMTARAIALVQEAPLVRYLDWANL